MSDRISDITSILNLFIQLISNIFNKLDNIEFRMFGYSVSFLGLVFGTIILGLIISVFWKGARD